MLLSVIFLTYLINKPPATVCSHDPQTSRATSIYDLLPPSPLKLPTVGRLDKDTTGALLITNDTKLVDFGTVSGHVEKVYEAKTMGILTEDQLDQLRTGEAWSWSKVTMGTINHTPPLHEIPLTRCFAPRTYRLTKN